jgi:Methyltransferase domain.
MTVKEIFSEIYNNKLWNSGPVKFFSGPGSAEESIVQPYIQKISNFLKDYISSISKKPRIVDLGCGNFEVGKHFVDYCCEYIGVDIVPQLIEELNKTKSARSVRFLCLDIIDDELPDGDIAFLRQVLQHLSNEQILKILPKLRKYKIVFITEHHPMPNQNIVYNKDMVTGDAIRACSNSGVYLDKMPFNIPEDALQLFLEVPGVSLGKGYEQGFIRTYKLEFPANE